jgi:hypothetical protein
MYVYIITYAAKVKNLEISRPYLIYRYNKDTKSYQKFHMIPTMKPIWFSW